jgi:hypothetical protein
MEQLSSEECQLQTLSVDGIDVTRPFAVANIPFDVSLTSETRTFAFLQWEQALLARGRLPLLPARIAYKVGFT